MKGFKKLLTLFAVSLIAFAGVIFTACDLTPVKDSDAKAIAGTADYICETPDCTYPFHAHNACGVSDCLLIHEHMHDCTLDGCLKTGEHTHCQTQGCNILDTHTHNSCGTDGCNQIGTHSHSLCGKSNCTTSVPHSHKNNHGNSHVGSHH